MAHSLTAAVLVAACAHHGAPTTAPTSGAVTSGRSRQITPTGIAPGRDSARAVPSDGGPRGYRAVISRDAVTQRGLFRVHRIGPRLLFEIPTAELGRDMLLVGRFARAAAQTPGAKLDEFGGDTFGERMIRWERDGNRILLRRPSYAITADTTLPVYRAVRDASYPPIIAAFDIATFAPDSAPVIDVTRLFTTTVAEFAALRGQVDAQRSFIERVSAFPDNLEIEATETATVPAAGGASGGGATVRSVLAHWSIVRLPTSPMMPRLADDRVGFFGATHVDFGASATHATPVTYIARWRLQKRDPTAAVSEPVRPIVYYIDAATPKEWRPWLRRAVLDWEPAFEAAGFRHALVVKDAPADDPNWSPDDVRHTVIRWLPSTDENAHGQSTRDPRTGEILSARIRVFQNVVRLQRNWYFSEVAPLDPRIQRSNPPDSLLGRLLEYIVSHEVGHTLGLFHNHKASSLYPADSVRSRTWVHRMGHTPSVMDYSRFNYVAQPEDSIALADLVPRVGPYDVFAIRWGYGLVPGAATPEAERPALEQIVRLQDSVPWYRFGHGAEDFTAANADPGDETEAVGDADPIQSTTYGLRNLRRTVPLLLGATQAPLEDNRELRELYQVVVKQWRVELSHVANVVGGARVHTKHGDQPGAVYTPLRRAPQAAAVQFLVEHAFSTPTFLLDTAVLRRLEPSGSIRRVSAAQGAILRLLLDDARTERLVEYEGFATDRSDVYTMLELLHDLRSGIWRELAKPTVTIDPFRRALQSDFVAQLAAKVDPPDSAGRRPLGPPTVLLPDVRAQMRGELAALRSEVVSALPRARDAATRMHLAATRERIDAVLATAREHHRAG